jgi:hypothetical protein
MLVDVCSEDIRGIWKGFEVVRGGKQCFGHGRIARKREFLNR